jgi:hypothetical protein
MIGPRYAFFWVVEYEEWKWAKKIIDIGLNGPFGMGPLGCTLKINQHYCR